MSRLTKHNDYGYPFDLRQQPSDVIHREFSRLLHGVGSTYAPEIVEVGVLINEQDLDKIHGGVMRGNNDEARSARRENRVWIRRKVVVWRGCYAIVCRAEDRYARLQYGRPTWVSLNVQPLVIDLPTANWSLEVRAPYDFASQMRRSRQ